MAYIKGISYYLPEKVLTNEELVQEFPEWSVEKVAQKIGVYSRHVADVDETAGDMAEKDKDGFIYLVDRKKDVIISGGENLYPVQIENFLSKHPKIKDVAVIGLADTRLGEIAAAVIELKPGEECTEDEINEFCLDLPRYKRPRKVIFADVPRNATGKIEKPKMRKMYNSENLVDAQNKA